jgi:hypothetical protein
LAYDEDGALAEIEELKRLDTQYNAGEKKAYAELTDKERELATLEVGVGVEVALQMRKNAEAELMQKHGHGRSNASDRFCCACHRAASKPAGAASHAASKSAVLHAYSAELHQH